MIREKPHFHGTTIILVRRGNHTAIAGDGQVTLGDTVVKQTARKIRRMHDGRILVDLPAPQQMRSPSSPGWKQSWNSSRET
jgi:hypothetical protein